ncbi:hypothetical protein POV27_18435 [Aureisphaera galaxeae]|uniref:hypothetical protein n=1 Tax=Aureisphaera galaxeae TaxID=1538023 RepID=UPI002350ECC2|nr:hypothetical protein [Aureisphaera galaxeae]MDC8006036.1 hypothetical protein [Aureisphaera galaxeae]
MSDLNFSIIAHKGEKRDGTRIEGEIAIPFEDFSQNHGKPITKEFALKLIKENVWDDPNLRQDEIVSITFDARPILFLLSQKDCTGIRFYFAKHGRDTSGRRSNTLVMVGTDKDRNDLIVWDKDIEPPEERFKSVLDDRSPSEPSLMIQVGGGETLKEISDRKVPIT